MEKDYLSSDVLMDVEFTTQTETKIHYHENFELLYVLNGELSMTVEGEEYQLKQKDLIIVNYNRKHRYTGSDDLFLARFVLSYSKVKELLAKDMILFWCNSTLEKNESYDEMRKIIDQILNQQIVTNQKNQIYKMSLYYQLLHVISKNFLLTSENVRYQSEKKNDSRMEEIFQFIRANYQKSITLQELADHFFLSTAYLSKYIKKKCNVSFTDLVNSVRLTHSMTDLLYTDASIMKIAMDNGFASVAAYNKVFKEAYDMTPSLFRKNAVTTEKNESDSQDDGQMRERLNSYLNENQITDDQEEESHDRNISFLLDHQKAYKQTSYYSKLINAGTAIDLTKSDFQEQIIYLKKKLGAEYIRFWDIYDPNLYLDIHASKENLNFSKLDTAIDFLVKNQLKPYIELGFKPIRLLKNTQDALVEIPRNEDFDSPEEMQHFFRELLRHFIKRYGSEEVQKWYFEYWKKEDIAFLDLRYNYSPQTKEVHRNYFSSFDRIAGTMRKILPDIKIGGGGFPVQHYGNKGFRDLLSLWQEYDEKPNFLTITCYPYQLEKESDNYYEKKSTDIFFVKHNLEVVKEALAQSSFPETPIHVSEYSLTLSNRNPVNDHCAKGSYLIQNMISTIGGAELFGHWLGTDIYADLQDSQGFLFGGCGLLTKTGVAKPAFYALEFLNSLYEDIYYKEKHCVVTGNTRGSFRIACHNYRKLNFNYYLTDESKIQLENLSNFFEDNESLTLNIDINGVENGAYVIKSRVVNRTHGSVQDEWSRFDLKELSMNEQDYLHRISTPRLLNTKVKVENNRLQFSVHLKPHEIRYLHVTME
ncbi:GH39 family glycosyl hydrolase [Enterococcus sp.]|uniref:GH39 family glycosyl hydrolase n=1 Tax=Enterococcus sp. TaxID=35783 RepID=UPI002911A5D8|nr:helix-turn-helix domain-containing protein [Enterococcus sp.]MDU5335703.1 helix-turn-helix domain-containing protein [Enterococcus sp.]